MKNCNIRIMLMVFCALGSAFSYSQSNLEEIIDAHHESASKLSTLRFSGNFQLEKFGKHISSRDELNARVNEKAREVKKQNPDMDDADVTHMAKGLVDLSYSDSREKYRFKIIRRNENEIIEDYERIEKTVRSAIFESEFEEPEKQRIVSGHGKQIAWALNSFENDSRDTLCIANGFAPLVKGICDLGTLRWARLEQSQDYQLYRDDFVSNDCKISRRTSTEIVVSKKHYINVFTPLHGFLRSKTELKSETKDGEEYIRSKSFWSDFAQSNGVWYPKKSIIESYNYSSALGKAILVRRWSITVEEMEINGKITDDELDFVVPANTSIFARIGTPGPASFSSFLPHHLKDPMKFSEIEQKILAPAAKKL